MGEREKYTHKRNPQVRAKCRFNRYFHTLSLKKGDIIMPQSMNKSPSKANHLPLHSSKIGTDEFVCVCSPSWQMLEEFQNCFHLHSLFANKSQHLFMLLNVELEFIKKKCLTVSVSSTSEYKCYKMNRGT